MTAMRGCRLLFAALLCAAAMPAAAESLENSIEGNFKATGTNRVVPGRTPERMICRLAGTKTGATTFDLSGRCATANQSGTLRLSLTVIAPGARYEMDVITETEELEGYDCEYHYTGIADETGATFETRFTLGGTAYRSSFRLSSAAGGIERMVETVTSEADGTETVLVDLKVTRD